jgi:uncharacterized protein (TIGR01777 family)
MCDTHFKDIQAMPDQPNLVIVAGGSGFLGIALARRLAARGDDVVLLSRNAPKVTGPWRHVTWDGRTLGPWHRELDRAAAIVNLAGRNVNCIKTPDNQDEILRSRVEATRVLGEALRSVAAPPPVWIQMSTAHIYGDPPTAVCDEDSPLGIGLAPFVGRAWEEAFQASVLPGQRGVVLRTSFVLGRNQGVGGGALDTLAMLARLGLGGRVARGTQGLSWIHVDDLCRMIERGLDDAAMSGVYVASAPHPVPQVEFMRELRRAVRMPIGLPATESMVRFACRFLLRTDPDLALYGRYVTSKRLDNEGFEFLYPRLRDALADIFRSERAIHSISNMSGGIKGVRSRFNA